MCFMKKNTFFYNISQSDFVVKFLAHANTIGQDPMLIVIPYIYIVLHFCFLTETVAALSVFQIWWDPGHCDHRLAQATLMLVATRLYFPRHLLLCHSHCPGCHGYEQWPSLWEAGPRRWQANQQSLICYGCHGDKRLRQLSYKRLEKLRGSDGSWSG